VRQNKKTNIGKYLI